VHPWIKYREMKSPVLVSIRANNMNRKLKASRTITGLALTVFFVAGKPALGFTVNTTPLTPTEKNIETLGTGIAIALPIVAGGIAVWKHDRVGVAQLAVEGLLTVGTAYALKNIVRERRPDGSDYQSFPSETTAVAASGSTFLWDRYGWQYGLPATAMTEFVSYSRVQARQHRWYDTLASSAIAAGYGLVVTTPFKRRYNIDTSFEGAPDGGLVKLSYAW
jgi:membrane-associated phospholipid phosphatase